MDLISAKKIMGKNFIGPTELGLISVKMGIFNPLKIGVKIPKIPFTAELLKKNRYSAILILGMPKIRSGQVVTVNTLRARFGLNPKKSEPCFYNQDWYINERFADKTGLKFQWYLLDKSVKAKTRGRHPQNIKKALARGQAFPSAILATFAFFAYYFHTKGGILWKDDFVWCADKDKNGDQIYVGRYHDPKGINKNGFNIHRYLQVRSGHGLAAQIT